MNGIRRPLIIFQLHHYIQFDNIVSRPLSIGTSPSSTCLTSTSPLRDKTINTISYRDSCNDCVLAVCKLWYWHISTHGCTIRYHASCCPQETRDRYNYYTNVRPYRLVLTTSITTPLSTTLSNGVVGSSCIPPPRSRLAVIYLNFRKKGPEHHISLCAWKRGRPIDHPSIHMIDSFESILPMVMGLSSQRTLHDSRNMNGRQSR